VIAETTVPIEIGGQKRLMYFNGNTMTAYEQATGKFFLDTLAKLYDVMRPILEASKNGNGKPSGVDGMEIMRHVSMTDLRALLWAALHEYGPNDEPRWPLTIGQVGRLITPSSVSGIFSAFLRGQAANSPTSEELGESVPPAPAKAAVPSPGNGSGAFGTVLPEGAFDSPVETPEG
jgi:hypothetical protein